MKLNDLLNIIEKEYDLSLQEEWDCSGLLYDSKIDINNVLVCLDITYDVINKAIKDNIDIILSHHPLLWGAYYNNYDYIRDIYQIAYANKISIYSMHTNFDYAKNGMNDNYLKTLKDIKIIDCVDGVFIIEAKDIFKSLNDNKYKYVIYNKKDNIKKIALILGGGSSLLELVSKYNCDAYISSDFKHSDINYAQAYNITIIDNFHISEKIFVKIIEDFLNKYTDLKIYTYDSTYNVELVSNN